jgi:hypothetical protein
MADNTPHETSNSSVAPLTRELFEAAGVPVGWKREQATIPQPPAILSNAQSSFPHKRGNPSEYPANSGVMKMSNDVTLTGGKTVLELDGFNDFTDEVEGEDNVNSGGSIIQGKKLKFIDPDWLIEGKIVTGMVLTAVNVVNVSTKWGLDNKPLVTEILAPGVKFPNFEKRNKDCPESEWRMAFGKKVGPWSGQHCVYLIDELYNPYTWASPVTTIGSAIAVRELVTQIKRVRRLRGDNAYPVVELSRTYFPNAYKPDRERPFLIIKNWVNLGADRTANALPPPTAPALPGSGSPPAATSGTPVEAQSIAPITPKEELRDEIPW